MTKPCRLVPTRPDACQPRRVTNPSFLTRALLCLIAAVTFGFTFPAAPAHAAPELWLPTPLGERWQIIQGYGCGTHNAWDHYSLDLVNADGPTYGAPVRAAAAGRVFYWGNGTLILDHGGGFYTMYTHLASATVTRRGHVVSQGEQIGIVGDIGTPGLPHLHFTAFTGHGRSAGGRQSVPLSFAEGYDLPEAGGCNQHGGTIVVAGQHPLANAPGLAFAADIEPNRWYSGDLRIEFGGQAAAAGFSQAWNADPGGDAPQFSGARTGYMQLSWAGEGLHTLFVRAWDAHGQQTLATLGPIGYDTTPPLVELPPEPLNLSAAAGVPALLSWPPASDNGSGVSGYRVYVGADPAGSSEWFVEVPQVSTQPLEAGRYLVRIQPIDYAGNIGEWVTIATLTVE